MINKTVRLFLFITFISVSISAQQVDQGKLSDSKMKRQQTTNLYKEIAFVDSCLFAAFNNCDTMAYKKYFTDDLEFYHDRGGLTTSKKDLVTSIKNNICGKVNRELLPGSIEVYPIPNYGAVQMGAHRFQNKQENSTSRYSKFVHTWHRENGQWKLSRVISLH